MKKKINKNKISILITNFNKDKFIKNCLRSCLNQTYKNIEVILFDDCSTDKSLSIIKKFKNINILYNRKKKYNSGPLNQINGLQKCFHKSSGDIIFLLDSDDSFRRNKVLLISNLLKRNSKLQFIQDTPYSTKDKKRILIKKKSNNYSIWPSFFPTSSIAMKRRFFKKFLKFINSNHYPNLEIDARIAIYAHLTKNFKITSNCLTYYNYDETGITSKYKKFTPNWWKKRKEAFQYTKFLSKRLKLNFYAGPDYYLTKIINLFFSTFYKSYH